MLADTVSRVGTFHVTVGRLLRRQVRRELEKAALEIRVDVEIREDKGLLDSVLYVTVYGERAFVFIDAAKHWVNELSQ